ncbi:D-alanine-D-alanine ligase [Arcticibacter tournemirensis]|uniref:D-alanine--D-alanine ligase n=1 Tax=Arcticibacter tournemirensis TaxID=699437 RepID=A0A5M9H205_9SPHI|nr:D-alanine--D-alanine ligase [Arcticibacter tournemirensis]KAA8480041.1 D-alanine--D-alanine ligase [Arcticibacter tournemirensis]TQM50643.1 D-alanine-D-alanine ligase [Arcticibacter tournemirensis]
MKKTIALVTGGFTGESVISLKSAEVIERNIDSEKFEVYKIIITPESWYYIDRNAIKHTIDKNDFSLNIQDKVIRFDGVFIGLHGSPGEDGKLQGYFDMVGLPYTSCDALTSAITMNKGYTKAIVEGIKDLHTARSIQLFANTPSAAEEVLAGLNLPLFVKPNNGGSSIGMSKVKTAEELPLALEKAFKEDDQVLVEEYIAGREFTIGVYKGKEGIKVLPSTEIVSSKEFFDYEAKYTAGITDEITPGRMTGEEQARVERVVTEAFRRLNCRGVVRIDYILEEETGKFFFIEVNTVPGQTEASLIPQQVRETGRTITDFYTELLETALGK